MSGASVGPRKMSEVTESDSGSLEPPAHQVDDELQDAEVVEHRGKGGEEDDDRQHLEGEDRARVRVRQHGAEEKLYALVGGVYDRLDAAREDLQGLPPEFPVEDDKGEGDLDDQGADHRAQAYGPAVCREQERNREEDHHAADTPQDLHAPTPF